MQTSLLRCASALVVSFTMLAAAPASAVPLPGWGLDRIDTRTLPLDGRYAPAADGTGVTVYLIDAGLDVSNSQFGRRASLRRNFTGTSVLDCADESGVSHGTFVAGIAGGVQTGVAPAATLVELQALGCVEGGSTMTRPQQRRAVIGALNWIRRHAARPAVVNMSLGFGRRNAELDAAVQALIDSGVPVVAAAGNEGAKACDKSPGHIPAVITVAASTRRDRAWVGSNQGACVDIWAPGKGITSVLLDEGVIHYRFVGATSWATPYVSGAVALYLQRHPLAGPANVRRWLVRTSTKGALTGVKPGTPNRLLYVGDLS